MAQAAERIDQLHSRAALHEDRPLELELALVDVKRELQRLVETSGEGERHWASPSVAAWRHRVEEAFSSRSSMASSDHRAVCLDTDIGPLLFPAGDEVVMPWVRHFGWWEREEHAALEDILKPGMTFLDVGAHVGYLTIVAARAVAPGGHGIAVEPAPTNIRLLHANLARAGVASVAIIEAAAWRQTGHPTLSLSAENSGDHRTFRRPGAETMPVPAVALDDVLPDDAEVHVVKTDTQGTDHVAIQGLERTIRRWRPVMLVEFWPPGIEEFGDDPVEVLTYYQSLGYELRVLGQHAGGDGSAEDVVATALSTPGRYCTLLLRPA